jgi:hypothetical protein
MYCPKCGFPIKAQVDEIAWVCSQCLEGVLLNNENQLELTKIQFQQSRLDVREGFPFWVTTVKVSLYRETLRGNLSDEMLQFWQNPRIVFIPAFEMALEELLKRAEALIKNPPILFNGSVIAFKPVVLSPLDLKAYIEFLVLQIEASRQDDLKQLTFELQLDEPALWILPG